MHLGLEPMARIRAVGRGACHPSVMGLSAGSGSQKPFQAKQRILKWNDFELVELNEAFAAQYLSAVSANLSSNRDITNVNGSGIGLGHPVGATGCRIMVTLLLCYERTGKRHLGLATLCGGGGVSMACALEMC